MTRKEAIWILDPETTGEEISKIEYYGGFRGRTAAVHAVSDACILAVEALREQEDRRWIPVKERFPEYGQEVLVYTGNILKPIVMEYTFWRKDYDTWRHVTHWMPLPEPPKEEE